jgi:hypothetical protein
MMLGSGVAWYDVRGSVDTDLDCVEVFHRLLDLSPSGRKSPRSESNGLRWYDGE